MRNHTSAHSFFVNLSTDPPLGPLLEIGVDVTSNTQTHEIRVKIPADSQHALPTAIISAFRKLDQLVVHADSYEFRIKFSPHKVDVAAASALIDSDGVLLIWLLLTACPDGGMIPCLDLIVTKMYPVTLFDFYKDADVKVMQEGPRREKDKLAVHDAWTVKDSEAQLQDQCLWKKSDDSSDISLVLRRTSKAEASSLVCFT
ncbi:hypothetical protein V8E53_007543 [Lactarius tabidus]